MTTLTTSFYEETMTFTASSWTEEEEWYIGNSDFAYIFYASEDEKQDVMSYLEEEIEDAMFLAADDGTLIFFTNEELSIENKEEIEFELGIDTMDQFTGTNGIYNIIDLDAE